jgi:hypothetical protein
MRLRFLPIALLSAALQLTASLSLAMDLVVCSKGTGHVAIESGMNDECCDDTNAAGVRSERPSGDDHCVDTPVVQGSIDPGTAPKHALATSQARLLPVLATLGSAPRLAWTRTAGCAAPGGPPLDLLARASIVLLV